MLEMGVNDDWSYAWTARGLAQTGHFTYSGWSEPMLGVQATWAAALIRLFGFSFTVVRLSTLPFAGGCAFLLYVLARRAGLNAAYAAFGSLAVAVSPLFIPLSASFMTDGPSYFFWLACVYCAERAARGRGPVRAGAWMAAAAAAGVAGGSVRQVVWMVPVVALAAVAWLRRSEKLVVAIAAVCGCASVGASALCLKWFLSQPNAQLLTGSQAPGWPDFPIYALASVVWLTVGGALFALPAMTLEALGWGKESHARGPVILALATVAALAALHWCFRQDLLVGNTVTLFGVLNGVGEALGARPVVVTPFVRALLKLALVVGGTATLANIAGAARRARLPRFVQMDARDEAAGMLRFLWLMAPSCLIYGAVLLYRGILFDRYLVPLFPVVIFPLLWRQQRRIASSPPLAAWAVLVVMAAYGVATTHDYYAASRARYRAMGALLAAGIPRANITVGLESDAWAELEHTGHIAAAVVPTERKSWWPERPKPASTASPSGWFWRKAPSIGPAYFVTYSRFTDLHDASPPVAYVTWMPPAKRQVFTQAR